MNALSVIFPYRLEGVWVFDDAATGLVREPFISGADTILDVLAEHIPNAVDGFKIVFSARPFPGYTARFVWTRAEYEAIGIGGQSGKWKDGCVRPSSSISKALPKRFSCRRPLKAREIRRLGPKEHASFQNSQRPPSHPEILSQVSRRERVQASGSISADSRDSR